MTISMLSSLGITSPHLAYIAVASGGITSVGNLRLKFNTNWCPDFVCKSNPTVSLGLNDGSIVAINIWSSS